MKLVVGWIFATVMIMAGSVVMAQSQVWVQIESQPSLREAEARARAYAGVFPNVVGFSTTSGWYSIALGPYPADVAEDQMANLKTERMIPRDSYISDGSTYGRRFWPVGEQPLALPDEIAGLPDTGVTEDTVEDDTVEIAPVMPVEEVDETKAEARRSEAELGNEDRQLLQTALQWEGFYSSAIDGSFGPGTRNSMAAWQEAMGLDVTGVLTTKQRATLVGNYRAALAELGLAPVTDDAAGIAIDLPTALVEFKRYEPPFVHYDAKADSGVRVLLISQQGDQATLYGLYDIMQTLEIVPLEGERERKDRSFVLTGQDAKIRSYTYAALEGGFVKGFTLIWPASGDEKLMGKVVEVMKATFTPIGDRALDATLGQPSAEQRADLLSGLDVRRPELSRSGFYIDGKGTVLTTNDVLQQCARITIDEDHEADVTLSDPALGIAVLTPRKPLSPMGFASFQTAVPRLKSEVAVAGYSYEDALEAPVMTFGALADLKGLNGEADLARLALPALPGDAGGPVFDTSGSVMGMMLPRKTGDRVLPDDVSFALDAEAIAKALTLGGIAPAATTRSGAMAAEDLTRLAMGMTVKVSCWN